MCLNVYLTQQYSTSFVVANDIRQVPLKLDFTNSQISEGDRDHLRLSADGMKFFWPVDIYPHNCQAAYI